jgi:uncharacterized protein YwqG
MDNQSEKKRAKLKGLKRNLESDLHVQNHQLKRWLSDGGFKEMEDDWKSQQSLRVDLSSPPEEITEYKKRLQKVELFYYRAENYSQQKRTATAEDMYHKSKVLAEQLIEFLHGFLQTDQSLQMWFDRLPDENNRGLTPESLPQVITSRSRFNQGGGFSRFKKSKQEVKIDAVERAITALDEPQVMDDAVAARSARMRSVLKRQE